MEEQLKELLAQIGPEALLFLIDLLQQLSDEQINQLKQSLQQMIGQSQGQQAQSPAPTPPPQGQQNIYG